MTEELEPQRQGETEAEFSRRKSLFEAAQREKKRDREQSTSAVPPLEKFKRIWETSDGS